MPMPLGTDRKLIITALQIAASQVTAQRTHNSSGRTPLPLDAPFKRVLLIALFQEFQLGNTQSVFSPQVTIFNFDISTKIF